MHHRAQYLGDQPRPVTLPDFGRVCLTRGHVLQPLTEADKAALDAEGWPVRWATVEDPPEPASPAADGTPKRVRATKPDERAGG